MVSIYELTIYGIFMTILYTIVGIANEYDIVVKKVTPLTKSMGLLIMAGSAIYPLTAILFAECWWHPLAFGYGFILIGQGIGGGIAMFLSEKTARKLLNKLATAFIIFGCISMVLSFTYLAETPKGQVIALLCCLATIAGSYIVFKRIDRSKNY